MARSGMPISSCPRSRIEPRTRYRAGSRRPMRARARVVLRQPDSPARPTLEAREEVIRLIREWRADLVLGPRPHDYHPDHRYTGVLVQDAAYLVVVPALVRAAPALRKNPVFLYYEDRFQKPGPFRADVRVRIDAVLERKLGALDAHASQFYEWLPWVEGNARDVPEDAAARREWLRRTRLQRRYGAFELCEYGAHAGEAEIGRLLPMLGGGMK